MLTLTKRNIAREVTANPEAVQIILNDFKAAIGEDYLDSRVEEYILKALASSNRATSTELLDLLS